MEALFCGLDVQLSQRNPNEQNTLQIKIFSVFS